MGKKKPEELRSHRWFGASDLRAMGPVIAILNTWSDANPCHAHFRLRADEVKRGIWQAGGFPMEIPLLTLGETFMKPSTMMYRNLLAMEAEEALRSYPADGAVLLGGCDKTVPALIMGATSANLPAIFVPAGPMLRGNWRGQILGSGSDVWKYWTERRAGTLDECAWREMEDGMARSFGTCMTMGTASTMASAVDALGLTLPGRVVGSRRRFRAPPARQRQRPAHRGDGLGGCEARGTFCHRGVRERRDDGDGARRIDQRHHPPHRDGRAGRRAARSRPLRCAVAADAVPRQHPAVGPVPHGGFLLRRRPASACSSRLTDLLHLDCLTANGRTLGENIRGGGFVCNDEVIAPRERPLGPEGGLAVLRGQPGATGRRDQAHRGAERRLLQHTGPAVVFRNYNDMDARIDDPDLPVTADSVLVLQDAGPLGGPGMPEWGMLPDSAEAAGSRACGTWCGLGCADERHELRHVRAARRARIVRGGPLALVRDGDRIELNVPGAAPDAARPRGRAGEAARGLEPAAPGVPARLRAAVHAARDAGTRGLRFRLPPPRRADGGAGHLLRTSARYPAGSSAARAR
jgi:dihydroxyacid dehydratase/phosphogluconate dehydratase